MNVNMNVITRTTSKKLDIINASGKTEQFKKVLDNHEFRFRNLTNENAQKKYFGDENTNSGIEKTIAYGNTEMSLNDSKDTTELKAEIIKFIEISIDAVNQNPVNLDGELRAELISFVQTAVDGLKQTPENLSKDSAEKDGNNDSMVQIQQLLQSLSSIFENHKSVSETKSKESSFNSMDLEILLDDNLIGVENLTPDVKNTLKNNLTKIFALIDKSDANTDEPLPIQIVLEKLITEVSGVKEELDLSYLNDSKDNRSLRAEIINFVQIVTEALIPKLENKINSSKPQVQEILRSLSSIFKTQQSVSKGENPESYLKPVDLEKMIDDHLVGVENLTQETKDILKDNLIKIFTLIEKSDANKVAVLPIQNVLEKLITEINGVKQELDTSYFNDSKDNRSLRTEIINFVQTVTDALNLKPENEISASKTQVQQILQSLNSIFQTQQSVAKGENEESSLKPVYLEKMIDDHLVGIENLTPETKDILKDSLIKIFILIEKSDSIASKTQVQQILKSLSSIFETQQSVSKSENQESVLKPVDLKKMLDEHIIGVENLTPETKNTLKNNLTNIFEIVGKSDANKYEPLQIQNVLESLTTEVSEVQGDLRLLTEANINVQEVQIQQILQSLNSMFQSAQSDSITENQEWDVSSINIEQLIGVENLTPETKNMLKKSFSEIFVLIEKLETSVEGPSKILQVLQKLTTEVHVVKGDLSLLKIPSTQSVVVNSEVRSIKDNHKSTFEEKFLGDLICGDKDDMKISKAVNFMNQFKGEVAFNTGKVESPNFVIAKNNLTVDIVKSIKFMETNNIKNLTVTMSPKELGEITIKLTVESGIMKAFISAQNKETFNLLSSNMQDITDKLKNMDIKIQSLDINIYEDSTFFNKDSNKKNNNGGQTNNSKTNSVLEEKEDVRRRDNYAIEQSTVNKFV